MHREVLWDFFNACCLQDWRLHSFSLLSMKSWILFIFSSCWSSRSMMMPIGVFFSPTPSILFSSLFFMLRSLREAWIRITVEETAASHDGRARLTKAKNVKWIKIKMSDYHRNWWTPVDLLPTFHCAHPDCSMFQCLLLNAHFSKRWLTLRNPERKCLICDSEPSVTTEATDYHRLSRGRMHASIRTHTQTPNEADLLSGCNECNLCCHVDLNRCKNSLTNQQSG